MPTESNASRLLRQFGQIDIYLFDQILRGRFDARRRLLDAGCGRGRNLVYFMQEGFDVYGVDQQDGAIASIRRLAAQHGVADPDRRFETADLAALLTRTTTSTPSSAAPSCISPGMRRTSRP
ncbi:MAG: methyltransferase domain-containing protein [Rhodothermales bacterium]